MFFGTKKFPFGATETAARTNAAVAGTEIELVVEKSLVHDEAVSLEETCAFGVVDKIGDGGQPGFFVEQQRLGKKVFILIVTILGEGAAFGGVKAGNTFDSRKATA